MNRGFQVVNALFAIVFAVAVARPANAAPILQVDSSGILTGAKGVNVNGTLFDVRFVDDLCTAAFNGCDELTDADFPDHLAAGAASQALLDQVLLDGPLGDFDSSPRLTAGCGEPRNCSIATTSPSSLYASFPTFGPFFLSYAVNVPGAGDVALISLVSGAPDVFFAPEDTRPLTNVVFAKWSLSAADGTNPASVPEPASLLLLGSGIAGLAVKARRRLRGSAHVALVVGVAAAASLVPGRAEAAPPAAQSPSGGRCVALMLPTLRGADGSASDLASGLRDLVAGYLKGPSLQTVPLDARLPDQAAEEAHSKGCPTVLTITLNRKKGGSGGLGKVLGDAAGAAAWHMPYGGSTAKSTAVRSAAIAGTAAASAVASNTRAKDEMEIDYRLTSATAAVLKAGKDKAKASADGEDLVTPLVERMATVVAAALPR